MFILAQNRITRVCSRSVFFKLQMGFSATFELVSLYSQLMALSLSIKLNWPQYWQRYISFTKFFNFDIFSFYGLDLLDYRVHYLIVTSLLPLGISLVLLFLFKSPTVVVWFLLTLASLIGSIFAYFLFYFVAPQPEYKYTGIFSLVIFCLMFAIFILVMTIKWCRKRNNYNLGMEDVDNFEKIEQVELVHAKSKLKIIRNLIIGGGMVALGFLLNIGFFILAFIVISNSIVSLFDVGQRKMTRINTYFRKSGLKLILIILGFCYVPVTQNLMEILFCNKLKCGIDQIFNRPIPDVLGLTLIKPYKPFSNCLECIFDEQCPLTSNLCPGESDIVLVANNSFSCSSEIYVYFLPGAVLMLVCFTLGVPLLFHSLIKTISKFLKQIRITDKSGEEIWHIQTLVSKNSCSSLYKSFVLKWKYYKLFLMIYRLLIVVIFVFLNSWASSVVTSISLFFAHSLAFIFSLYSSPYSNKSEQFLFFTAICNNIINCILVITKASDVNIEDSLLPGVIVFYTATPVIMFLIGFWIDRRRAKKLFAISQEAADGLQKKPKEAEDFVKTADRSKIRTMDAILNRKLLNSALNYFIILGVVATISGCLGTLGIVSQNSKLKAKLDTRIQGPDVVQSEFGSFHNWNEFSENCCCLINMSDPIKGVEYWKCQNNAEFKYKVLKRQDGSINGYDIRSFCGREFNYIEPPRIITNGQNIFYSVHGSFLPGYTRERIKAIKQLDDNEFDKILSHLW